ncbi:MAG: DUF4006 family protein [Helicobacteraceae bacterium]|jgi:hypothetical protein|nr:DUF4006 family protein [Helicobacteraceae bacterium]
MSSGKSGSYFALNGISGMLVAVVLLLGIIGSLTVLGILTQQASAKSPYVVTGNAKPNPQTKEDVFANLKEVKMYDETGATNVNAFRDPPR